MSRERVRQIEVRAFEKVQEGGQAQRGNAGSPEPRLTKGLPRENRTKPAGHPVGFVRFGVISGVKGLAEGLARLMCLLEGQDGASAGR